MFYFWFSVSLGQCYHSVDRNVNKTQTWASAMRQRLVIISAVGTNQNEILPLIVCLCAFIMSCEIPWKLSILWTFLTHLKVLPYPKLILVNLITVSTYNPLKTLKCFRNPFKRPPVIQALPELMCRRRFSVFLCDLSVYCVRLHIWRPCVLVRRTGVCVGSVVSWLHAR